MKVTQIKYKYWWNEWVIWHLLQETVLSDWALAPYELSHQWEAIFTISLFLNLNGYFSSFEMALYEVLMHTQSVAFCRWRSVVSLFGEEGRNRYRGSQQWTVAGEVSRKTDLSHIYKFLPKQWISIQLYTKLITLGSARQLVFFAHHFFSQIPSVNDCATSRRRLPCTESLHK